MLTDELRHPLHEAPRQGSGSSPAKAQKLRRMLQRRAEELDIVVFRIVPFRAVFGTVQGRVVVRGAPLSRTKHTCRHLLSWYGMDTRPFEFLVEPSEIIRFTCQQKA